jgi:hypothetical protein
MPDNRVVIPVSNNERNQVLADMREFLHGLHNINHALARKDMKAVAVTARPMGPLLDRIPASLKDRLPEEFIQLTIAQNEAFKTLARDAETKGEVSVALDQMAEIITYCSGCHDTYRFDVQAIRGKAGQGPRHQGGR